MVKTSPAKRHSAANSFGASPTVSRKNIKKSAAKASKSRVTSASTYKEASPSKRATPAKKATKLPKSAFSKTVQLFSDQKDYFVLDQKYANKGFATRAIHGGNDPDQLHGGVVPSIEMSTTYIQPSPG